MSGDGFEMAPRDRVFALEAAMKGMDSKLQLSIPELTRHFIAGGVYVREFRLPAGTVAAGYIHLRDHVVTLIGDVTVYDETGTRRFTGVHTFTSKAGVKRAAYAHADTHFITAHRLDDPNTTDIAEIERELVTNTYQDFDAMTQTKGLLP